VRHEPSEQEDIVATLTSWCERTGDPMPLERALAGGDLLGGCDPWEVPPDVRNAIGAALSRRLAPEPPCPRAPACRHGSCMAALGDSSSTAEPAPAPDMRSVMQATGSSREPAGGSSSKS
jgi:hypothetical protein